MSLSIIQNPLILSPCNNPIPIVVSSTTSSDIGFRYYVTLNITGTTTSSVSLFIYPDTTNSNYMIYDAAMILSDFIGSTNNWNCSGITTASEDILDFTYSVTEYTLAVSGETITGGTFKTFRGVKQYGDFWDSEDYMMNKYNQKFLSNWEGNRSYKIDEYGTINCFYGDFDVNNKSTWDAAKIVTSDGGTFYIKTTPDYSSPKIFTLPTGPKLLNVGGLASLYFTKTGTTYDSYTGNIISSTTTSYTITLIQTGNTTSYKSETLTIDVDTTCYKHDGVQFLWLGELGTYETYTFRAKDIKSFNIERSESRKNYWGFDSTYHYSIGNRGRRIVNLKATEEHQVYSGWIDTTTSQNLMELYLSPEVFIIRNGNIYPIIITNKEIEEKTKLNNEGKIFFHTIVFMMAYEKMSNL